MSFRNRPALKRQNGLTIIEILIALTMTLIVLGAMMSAFGFASTQMRMGRAVMEMANRVRAAEDQMRSDLANLTVDPRPYTDTTPPNGYFEYIEGPRRDKDSTGTLDSYLGDVDDIIAMTVRSSGQLFRGRSGGSVIESSLAEIVWFTTLNDLDADGVVDFIGDSVRVHRRVLVIRPDLGTLLPNVLVPVVTQSDVDWFLSTNDISCRVVSTNATDTEFAVIANNLVDLSVRKNRFCHVIDSFNSGHNFPNRLSRDLLNIQLPIDPSTNNFTGDDVMLTDVAAFDVRVYSPNATVNIDSNIVVEPGDVGFNADPLQAFVLGAYVDLDHDGAGWFEPNVSFNPLRSYPFVVNGVQVGTLVESAYDTWTPFYESDGIDNDNSGLIDQGTNGLDDGGTAAPDDNAERETNPPYPYPIRGIEVTFRLIEKGTKQVHQSTVLHSYVPE